jgi:ubiquinone/menaquinone biosynthesis C-methylase UbiE
MSTDRFDPAEYKAGQRQQWDAAAAGWDKWWDTFEQEAGHISDRLVEMAEIAPGHRILDVATGIGEPALTAARRVGPTGRIVATDQAPQMLDFARKRADALAMRNVEFREMDAEALELPESSFDAILCRWGLMFLPNLSDALSSMRLLLVPGGRLAATVWSVPSKVPMISLAMGVVRQMLQTPAPPEETPGPFSLADSNALEQALRQAGFVHVRSERLTVTWELASVDEYVSRQQDVAAPLRAMLADQTSERQAEVWQAISDAAGRYAVADGTIRMPNEAICVVGRR